MNCCMVLKFLLFFSVQFLLVNQVGLLNFSCMCISVSLDRISNILMEHRLMYPIFRDKLEIESKIKRTS